MIERHLLATIRSTQQPGFITVIYGPRRVGKTVLLKQLTNDIPNVLWFNGDTLETQKILSQTSITVLSELVKHHSTVVIDEAQRITNIGLSLKILIDTFPNKTFYVSGSSSLDLSLGIQESLTGRANYFHLYPLSYKEQTQHILIYQQEPLLTQQLLFGGYPYLSQLSSVEEKKRYLTNLTNDYLYKDLFFTQTIQQPENIRTLTSLLAYQIGKEVSVNELALKLGLDNKTVSRYLYLLEQSFIIFSLPSYSKNLRKELSKAKKYYFYDLGIRNSLIGQWSDIAIRDDIGFLWENFLAIQRKVKYQQEKMIVNPYFWRTYDQTEIDWVEQSAILEAYEFKWNTKRKINTPKAFRDTYKTDMQVITPQNFLSFI